MSTHSNKSGIGTRRTIINTNKRNKEYDVIESVEIASISGHMNYEWRELVFCAGMGRFSMGISH